MSEDDITRSGSGPVEFLNRASGIKRGGDGRQAPSILDTRDGWTGGSGLLKEDDGLKVVGSPNPDPVAPRVTLG